MAMPAIRSQHSYPASGVPGRVQGVVEYVVHFSPESSFCIAKIRVDDEVRGDVETDQVVTVKGSFPQPDPGVTYLFDGTWKDDPKWGLQLAVSGIEVVRPSTVRGIERYLASGPFPNIGPSRARAMVERWGADTLAILDRPDAISALDDLHGITPDRAQRIVTEWQAHKAAAAHLVALYRYGLTPWQVGKIVGKYGDRAVTVLSEDPYQIMGEIPRFGFLTVDGIAGRVGIPRDDVRRARAAVVHLLEEATTEGHCYLPVSELVGRESQKAVDLSESRLREGLDSLLSRSTLLVLEGSGDSGLVYLRTLWEAERQVAEFLRSLAGPRTEATLLDAGQQVLEPAPHLAALLTPEQADAVRLGQLHRLLVVTGGPGVGKTFTLQAMLDVWRRAGLRVELAAPTGKAAQRMSDATGEPARTIHRLLEWKPEGFSRNELAPIDYAEVVVIDESSMVDIELARSLLAAIDPAKTRLVFVGDVDQLPSVGPGQVLADIIASGMCPVVRLTKIMRQEAGSAIIRTAHAVNSGHWPTDLDNDRDDLKWYPYGKDADPEAVAAGLLGLACGTLAAAGYDPIRDVQVLCPQKRGAVGTATLNAELQQRLNPPGPGKAEIVIGNRKRKGAAPATDGEGRVLRLGDKVIQTSNNYRLAVFNGEVGFITGIEPASRLVSVDFGDASDPDPTHRRVVEYSNDALFDLWPAYALTVHKSQGSEFPVVLIPVHTTHYMMLRRRLLYTGITRARETCVLLGTERALRRAVSCNEEASRHTRLAGLLRGQGNG